MGNRVPRWRGKSSYSRYDGRAVPDRCYHEPHAFGIAEILDDFQRRVELLNGRYNIDFIRGLPGEGFSTSQRL